MRHEKYLNGFSVYLALGLVFLCGFDSWGVPRGSGSNTTLCIGSPCDQLYLPVSKEEEGWGDGSTQSINNNFLKISSAVFRIETQASSTNYIQLRGTLQSGATFYVSSASVDGQALLSRTSGNVGIGTASPSGKLHAAVTSTSGGAIDFGLGRVRLTDDALSSNPRIRTADGNTLDLFAASGSNITFFGASTERMRIQSAGDIAIGTNTANLGGFSTGSTVVSVEGTDAGYGGALELIGRDVASPDGIGDIYFIHQGATSTAALGIISVNRAGVTDAGAMSFWTRPGASSIAERMRVQADGNVGIGTISPSARLQIEHSGAVATVKIGTTSAAQNGEELIIGDNAGGVGTAGIGLFGAQGLYSFYSSTGASLGNIHHNGVVGNMNINNLDGSEIRFNTNNTLRMTIGDAGNPFVKIAQFSNCAIGTPSSVGQICVQNSATQPIWIATATTLGGFQPLTMAAE